MFFFFPPAESKREREEEKEKETETETETDTKTETDRETERRGKGEERNNCWQEEGIEPSLGGLSPGLLLSVQRLGVR